jgi:hypothetical protein
LTVWHRGPFSADSEDEPESPELTLSLPHLRGRQVEARALYPDDVEVSWQSASGTLTVALPRTPSACVISLAS